MNGIPAPEGATHLYLPVPESFRDVQQEAIISDMKAASIVLAAALSALSALGQNDAGRHSGVMQRGEDHAGMGFSQTNTTHHFILTPSGGIIQVTANSSKDSDEISTIQTHMKHIAGMFSEGNFSIPHFVHDQMPPGVETMKQLQSSIRYSAEILDNGARVKIETASPAALVAIHDFLRFQIKDHETGDPLTVATP